MDWARAFLILGTLVVVGWPKIFEGAQHAVRILRDAGLDVPQKAGDGYAIPGVPLVDKLSKGGKIHISTCASGQHSKYAEELKGILNETFPAVEIVLTTFAPPETRLLLSKAASALQGFFAIMTVMGPTVLRGIGVESIPFPFKFMTQYRIVSLALIWAVGKAVTTILLTTGAFEVYCDGHLVYSTLIQNNLPAGGSLLSLLRKVLPEAEASFVQ